MMTSNDQYLALLNEIRTTQISQAEKFGRMAGQIEALAGPNGRISALETTDTRQYWMHALVIPVLTALHVIARRSGIAI